MRHAQPDLEQVKDLLPESVQHIAQLIGFPATGKLIDRFGGVVFPVGKGLRGAGHVRIELLQEVLTPEQVMLIIQHFGGERLYIPRCQEAWRAWRNRCFLADLDQLCDAGESITMALTRICPKYGIASTRAWELLKARSNDVDPQQKSLF